MGISILKELQENHWKKSYMSCSSTDKGLASFFVHIMCHVSREIFYLHTYVASYTYVLKDRSSVWHAACYMYVARYLIIYCQVYVHIYGDSMHS